MATIIIILVFLAVFLFPTVINHPESKATHESFNYIECTKKSDLQSAKRKKAIATFRNLAIAGVVVASIMNSCSFNGNKNNSDSSVITAVVEDSEAQESQKTAESAVNESDEHTLTAFTESNRPSPNVVQGDGYSFIKPDGWRLQQAQDGGDFEVHYSIPYIDKGVIAVYINRFSMDELLYEDGESFDDFAEGLFEIYSYVYSMEKNTTVSKKLEKTDRISGEVTYNFFVNTLSNIVTYDSSKVRYGKDEYGNTIITNMDELELVEYPDVPCRSNYYWVQNGNDLLEVNIIYTIEGIAKAEKYSEDFLDGIMLEKNKKENKAE